MIPVRHALIVVLAAGLLAGCSSFKRLTGQTDNTVLPGERENILPPDQQVNPKPENTGADAAAGQPAQANPCDPAVDSNCSSDVVDQEAPGGEGQ
jgi:hypothetical protein